MGFSMVDDGFYGSGHPKPGCDLANPLGVVKSTNLGKTIQSLDLQGDSDFHGMSVSYNTHTVYVLNPEPNSKMDATGLYYTQDDAKTWVKSKMEGLNEEPIVLTVHPSNDAIVAIGTPTGGYLSADYGDTFEKVVSDQQVTSLHFNAKGELFAGGFQGKPRLFLLDIETGDTKDIPLPPLTKKP